MNNSELHAVWDRFLDEWPVERVRSMTLNEYTNLNRSDAFVYWLEKITEDLGSIWGGSAFKWGIYHRNPNSDKPGTAGTLFDDTYGWYKRYGSTAEEAFRTIRERLLVVIEAAQQGDLERIEGTIVCWPIVKWKIAFLYQDRESPHLFPVFRDDWLFEHYQRGALGARRKDVSRAVMYSTLIDRYADRGDVFDIARSIWEDAEKHGTTSYWAVPLHVAMPGAEATALCKLEEVNPEDLPELVHEMLAEAEVGLGDRLALLTGDTVRAVGKLESAEPEIYAWKQTHVEVVPDLAVVPSKVIELDASERESIWGAIAPEAAPDEALYWKISPGADAHLWDEWKKGGYVSMGWDKFGDVSKMDRAEFERRLLELQGEHGYGPTRPRQVWRFRHIPEGARVVVSQGTRKLLGIGTVTGPYEYNAETGEHRHRRSVHWDDLTERAIQRGGWSRTLIQLDESEFRSVTQPELEDDSNAKPEEPPEPQSLILFGPPGTGKTWATMTRALQLIFPTEEVAAWSDDTRARQFRELQRQGQIEFVTFHQSYGYEEFVEGIRPVLSADATKQVRYELHAGAFKRIAIRAAAEGLQRTNAATTGDARFGRLWSELTRRVEDGEIERATSQQGYEYTLSVTSGGSITIRRATSDGSAVETGSDKQTASSESTRLLWNHRAELGPIDDWSYQATGDVFRSARDTGGEHNYTAFWITIKLLEQIEEELPVRVEDREIERTARVQAALDRPVAGTVDFQFSDRTRPYVLIIDEINRGNISKILGELITLLEPDKRLGATNELKLPLAYSPNHRFAVPPNLHIIGTMNTADRSIALMDAALRRRFRFEEMLPESAVIRRVLRSHVPDTALVDLVCDVFDTMNARIRQIFDRDHQIGHAYFLKVRSLGSLRDVFADRVIPLLQEYFYGAWERVCAVLGCPYDEDGTPLRSGPCLDPETKQYRAPIITAIVDDNYGVLELGHDQHDMAFDLQVSPAFRPGLAAAERRDDGLLEYFLGLLNLDSEAWKQRASAFERTDSE